MNNDKKQIILDAAMVLAETHGYHHISRTQIATKVGCATGLVSFYFGTMVHLRRAIVGEAIRTSNLKIIAQGLVMGDSRTRGLPDEIKQQSAATLMT